MEGDDDDEDNDIDQQESLPRLTTYKEDSYMYNCFATFKLLSIKDMDMKPCLSVQILTRLLT